MSAADRKTTYDVVQFGATGFAGGLTAEYLAKHAPADLRWALAGRNLSKLEAVRDRVINAAPDRKAPDVIEVALDDTAELERVVGQSKVVLTSVGPYALHGEPIVAAAAKTGADYVDITGEPQFVDAMYLKYQDQAVASGARLVHCAGFDSVPHDLGVLYTVRQLPSDGPIKVTGAVWSNGTFSGGTFQSAIGGMAAAREAGQLARKRRAKEAKNDGRKQKPVGGRPYRDPETKYWLTPLPLIDPQIVCRSAAELEEYGPDFSYDHRMSSKRASTIAVVGLGALTLAAAVQIPPVKKALLGRKAAGTGPDAERRARSRFSVRFTGEGGGQRIVTRVSGGDPGYDETAKMLAESALSLALDDNPDRVGQLTPAAAMGDRLLERLQAAGIVFETLSSGPAQR